jgi:hypothetical protein
MKLLRKRLGNPMTSNDCTAGLANLRAVLKRTRKTLKPPPMIQEPDYSRGLANLRTALRIARKAFISDEAYQAALKAERDRAWRAHMDRASRIIAASIGIKLD